MTILIPGNDDEVKILLNVNIIIKRTSQVLTRKAGFQHNRLKGCIK